MVTQLIEDNVLFVNSLEASGSYRWVYQHPEDEHVTQLIPPEPKALLEVNGKPIFAE
jgi:hypothetical protein